MNISSDIKPVSFLKSHAADILKQINDTHRPIVITQNGEPRGVLQDPESYDNMRKAIGLLKLVSQGEEDIKKGNTKTQDRVFKNIEKILQAFVDNMTFEHDPSSMEIEAIAPISTILYDVISDLKNAEKFQAAVSQ